MKECRNGCQVLTGRNDFCLNCQKKHDEAIKKLYNNHFNYEKVCQKCGAMMLLRVNKITGEKFWGCSNFRHCKSIQI